MMLEFDWDPAKNDMNLVKHGIDFPTAARVFDGPVLRIRSAYGGEKRWIAVGILGDREVAVIYTMREDRCRIISARRAQA